MIALVPARDGRATRGFEVQDNLDHAVLELARHVEPCVVEDTQHRAVLRKHLRDELLDPDGGRVRREPLEQPRAGATALEVVGDRECDLGTARVVQLHVRGERDRAQRSARAGELTEKRAARSPVAHDGACDGVLVDPGGAVEAEIAARRGEVAEEGDQLGLVGGRRRAKAERRAVPEDDVFGQGCVCGGCHRDQLCGALPETASEDSRIHGCARAGMVPGATKGDPWTNGSSS